MSVKDYVDVKGDGDEQSREFPPEDVTARIVIPLSCARCGYETDCDGYCNFCGHLSHWRRAR